MSQERSKRPEPEDDLSADSAPLTDSEFQSGSSFMESIAAKDLASVTEEIHFTVAHKLFEHVRALNGDRWAFRGQSRSGWGLSPLLERIAGPNLMSEAERRVEQQFLRRAHQYAAAGELSAGSLVTHSLMRHHGAPTRLLDWSKSPYIATFFALADARESGPEGSRDTDSAVWAINCDALRRVENADDKAAKLVPKGQEERYSLLLSGIAHWPPIVAAIEPVRMNERLTAQQGLFLAQSHLSFSFKDCLVATIEKANNDLTFYPWLLKKLVLKAEARIETLNELARMNINWATLTPGLDGFGASLCTEAETFSRADNFTTLFFEDPLI